jgi:hypothetical protein
MLTFKRELLSWGERIKRSGYLTELVVEDLPGGEFRLTGKWNGGEYSRTFTRQYVLGRNISRPPLQQRPHQRVCRFRDEFVRAVLAARGV